MAEETHSGTLRVTVVTPYGPIADLETNAVTAPGKLGEFEVFPGHVPLLTQLHPGVLTLGEAGKTEVFAVASGFLEVEASGAIQILVEKAVSAADADTDTAKAELEDLRPKVRDWKGGLDAEFANLRARHDWAQAQLDAVARIR